MLDQLAEVLLTDSLLGENVEEDDPDLVVNGDVGSQQDRNNVPHLILDPLPVSIFSHSQVLFHLTQFVHIALVRPHTFFSHVEVGGELGKVRLVLRHLLDQHGKISDRVFRVVLNAGRNLLLIIELLHLLADNLVDHRDVLVSQLLPQIVIFIKNDFFTRVDASVVFVQLLARTSNGCR